MEPKDNKINQIIKNLTDVAVSAADNVSDAVQSAGNAVGEKYNIIKISIELKRLHEEQDGLFCTIGRTMYMIQSGTLFSGKSKEAAELVDAQQLVDRLLLLADQKQQEIDIALKNLHALNGERACPNCAKTAKEDDVFCSGCGSKINPGE